MKAPADPFDDISRLPAAVHATAVVIGEWGILIRGPSGAGKSQLARALVEKALTSGKFARLVGDDRVILRLVGGRIVAHPHGEIAGLIEIRGQGIIRQEHEAGAIIRLVIDLEPTDADGHTPPRMPEKQHRIINLDGIPLARLHLPGGRSAADTASDVMAFLRPVRT
jgi:serine kinase of HPr protein (carbohydrate metabolism regulator)